VLARSWTGGTAGCQLPIAVSGQVRERLVERGLDPGNLDLLRHHLRDPEVVVLGNLTWSVVGRRASATSEG